jgi:membrane protein
MVKVWRFYKYISSKHYSTLAGTLVYFLVMSITPFLSWLTLIAGNVNVDKIISNEIMSVINPVINYLKENAESAVGGAGIILIATSLYSSTNFFYHLRRIGEIIFESKRRKGGLRLRLTSAAIILATLFCVAFLAALNVGGEFILNNYMPKWLSQVITQGVICLIVVIIAYLLNVFASPYKLTFGNAIGGSLLTSVLWIILAAGFSVYAKFYNPSRLYGKIASLIIFLLWCYVMINCLVIGIIYNSMYLTNKKSKQIF